MTPTKRMVRIGWLIGLALIAILIVLALSACEVTRVVGYECRHYVVHVDTLTLRVDSISYKADTIPASKVHEVTAEDCP